MGSAFGMPPQSHHITGRVAAPRPNWGRGGQLWRWGASGSCPPPPPCPCCCRLTVLETASEEGTGLVEGLYHSPFYQGELSLRQEANTDTLRLPGGMC